MINISVPRSVSLVAFLLVGVFVLSQFRQEDQDAEFVEIRPPTNYVTSVRVVYDRRAYTVTSEGYSVVLTEDSVGALTDIAVLMKGGVVYHWDGTTLENPGNLTVDHAEWARFFRDKLSTTPYLGQSDSRILASPLFVK